MSTLQGKHRLLQDVLRSYGKVAIAYSGGVDSSLLSYVAKETLGANAISLTADAPVVPRGEFAESRTFLCKIRNQADCLPCRSVERKRCLPQRPLTAVTSAKK